MSEKKPQNPVTEKGSRRSVTGTYRVIRGGYWGGIPYYLRSSTRISSYPSYRYNYYGFRLARTKK